jgi:hypothetical protein
MKACASLLCVLSLTVFCLAQGPATGFPPYGSFEEGRFDAINLQNLNVNFSIPIVSTPGRGMDFNFAITYDSSIWANGAGAWYSPVDQTGNQTWGWKKDWVTGITTYTATNHSCHYQIDGYLEIETTTRYSAYAYTDRAGTKHAFNLNFNADATPCNYNTGPTTGYATDNSGYYIDATNPDSPVVTDPTGIKYAYDGTVTDTNGNYFTKVIVSSTETDWKDTRGLPVLKIIYGSSSIQYQYYDPTGAYQTTTLNLQPVNIKTNFGCSGVTEYTGTANFPASLDLPNGKSYQFTYEQTPGFSGYYTGRVYQVTLPTGGYYQYQYAAPNDGINCSDSTGVNLELVS